MGNSAVKASAVTASSITGTPVPAEKPKCKACCACPETKKIRDLCIIENGESFCGEQIERHKQCMRDMGFNI